jgi:hypothetical protein
MVKIEKLNVEAGVEDLGAIGHAPPSAIGRNGFTPTVPGEGRKASDVQILTVVNGPGGMLGLSAR